MTGAKFVAPLGVTDREGLDAYALDAILGLTLGAMRGFASDAMRGSGLGEGEP